MAVSIKVTPLQDSQVIAFHDLHLLHDCGRGAMSKNRNPATDHYTLRCPCGLEIELLAEAQKDITFTAIDELTRTLSASSAQANLPGPMTVSAARQ